MTRLHHPALWGGALAELSAILASCGGGSKSTTAQSPTPERKIVAALVSDIGKFNDRSFNQN